VPRSPWLRLGAVEQFFLARRIEPDGAVSSPPQEDGCVLQAYNAQGQLIGHDRC
jgi:hypothetical protein